MLADFIRFGGERAERRVAGRLLVDLYEFIDAVDGDPSAMPTNKKKESLG